MKQKQCVLEFLELQSDTQHFNFQPPKKVILPFRSRSSGDFQAKLPDSVHFSKYCSQWGASVMRHTVWRHVCRPISILVGQFKLDKGTQGKVCFSVPLFTFYIKFCCASTLIMFKNFFEKKYTYCIDGLHLFRGRNTWTHNATHPFAPFVSLFFIGDFWH